MAMNVFGAPITISTLQGMVEYRKKDEITRVDKAKVALNMKNSSGNDVNIYTLFHGIGHEMQEDPLTLCVMYNATGATLRCKSLTDWDGHLSVTPLPFEIANGQWAGFAHNNPLGSQSPSRAAVVFRGKDPSNPGMYCEYLFAWYNPWVREDENNKKRLHNKAYTAVKGCFEQSDIEEIGKDFQDTNKGQLCYTCSWEKCYSSVSVGDVRKGAFVEAIFTLKEAAADI